jgi:hypothetical protein
MEVTSTYWRQLYLYLSRQQQRQRRSQQRLALRAAAADAVFRPLRVYAPAPKRPFSAPN